MEKGLEKMGANPGGDWTGFFSTVLQGFSLDTLVYQSFSITTNNHADDTLKKAKLLFSLSLIQTS